MIKDARHPTVAFKSYKNVNFTRPLTEKEIDKKRDKEKKRKRKTKRERERSCCSQSSCQTQKHCGDAVLRETDSGL